MSGSDPTGVNLFDLADKRLAWLDRRQQVLAQNVANADTPGWQAQDITPFAQVLAGQSPIAPLRTDPAHLAGTIAPDAQALPVRGERAPDGNAVSLDEQLGHVADTETSQEVVSELYKKYLGLMRTALGR